MKDHIIMLLARKIFAAWWSASEVTVHDGDCSATVRCPARSDDGFVYHFTREQAEQLIR